MIRGLALVLLLAATAAVAQNEPQATLSARVSAIDGNIIRVANGLLAIDASHAKIVWNGKPATIAAVTKQAFLNVRLHGTAFPPNSVLPATSIYVTRRSDVQLLGPVAAVDAEHGTLTILGITVAVDAQTNFDPDAKDLASVKPAQIFEIGANLRGRRLVAETVAAAPLPPDVQGGEDFGGVGGDVSSVEGGVVRIADGLIAIDRSSPEVQAVPLKRGSHILATVKKDTVVAGKPLVPTMINAYLAPEVTMNGAVTAADAANHTFTLLGRTICIDERTDVQENVELEPGALLIVFANRSGTDLIATFVSRWIPELD